ncbi:sensor histidine kinase [Kitasatospora sp. MAA4]|uniref:sensor histidine kinase n=1 Tax=Kitasatospora sp. MAA4 TaxID=3035093 RepID=UPI002472EEA4|nr:sensor histidine kinase [Kitasatospora sp. MAA4]
MRLSTRDDALPWTRNDALVTVGACGIDLLGYSLGHPVGGHQVTVVGIVLSVLSALPLLVRRSHPVSVLAGVLVLGTALNLLAWPPTHFGAALAVALYSVARACGPPVTAPAGIVTAAVTLLSQTHGGLPSRGDVIGDVAAVVVIVGVAVAVTRYTNEVAANRQLLADHAVAEERRRIARELHDIVAHHITTMQLMAGGARANLAGDPEVVRDALVTLESSGRSALREMRQLLDVLRADDEPEHAPPAPQPGAGELDRIVGESRLAGLPTEFTVRGQERPLPPTVGLTVFRVVQEALTNARKHAGQSRASVLLTYLPDRVTVEVQNDGGDNACDDPGDDPWDDAGDDAGDSDRSGYGLIGMYERVALHGGSLETGRLAGGGFRVAASLPVMPDAREEVLR